MDLCSSARVPHWWLQALIYFNFDGVQQNQMALSDIISTPPINADTSSQELFNSYVRTSLRQKHLFPLEDLETTRLESVVKRAFREENAAAPDRRIDAAFIAMRRLAAIWNAFAEKKSATAALQPVVAPFDVQIAEYMSTLRASPIHLRTCTHAGWIYLCCVVVNRTAKSTKGQC